jgi:hypothetical protein
MWRKLHAWVAILWFAVIIAQVFLAGGHRQPRRLRATSRHTSALAT